MNDLVKQYKDRARQHANAAQTSIANGEWKSAHLHKQDEALDTMSAAMWDISLAHADRCKQRGAS